MSGMSPHMIYVNPEMLKTKIRRYVRYLDGRAGGLLDSIDLLEQKYRNAGRDYHISHPRVRKPRDNDSESLTRLKADFETCHFEEYQAIFARSGVLRQDISDLRSKVRLAGVRGTLEERYHTLLDELGPATYVLRGAVLEEVNKFDKLSDDALSMRHVSLELDVLDSGCLAAWLDMDLEQTLDQAFGPPDMLMLDKWNFFRAWVWSLPDTQRVNTAGNRSLD